MENSSWQDLFPDFFHPPSLSSPPSRSVPSSKPSSSSSPQIPAASSLPQPKTFAQALKNACDIPLIQLPPCIKGDAIVVKIPEDEYKASLEG